MDADVLVLIGPIITKYFLKTLSETIKEYCNRNKKYIMLGIGMMHYSENDLMEIKKFLNAYPPLFMSSRDNLTYETFCNIIPNIYNGLDLAFFVPEAYKPIKSVSKYIVSNFDKITEPNIYETKENSKDAISITDEENIKVVLPRFFSRIGLKTDRISDIFVYLGAVLPKSKRQDKVYNYSIIRPDHRFWPMFVKKVYRYNNSYCSEIPEGYFNIYANSSLTVTDRIHACILTLAYGNKAMFFAKTARSGLLDRVGAEEIYHKPVQLSLEKLNKEKENMIAELKSFLKNI